MNKDEAFEVISSFKEKSSGTKEELEGLTQAIRYLSTIYPQFERVVDEADVLIQVDIMDVVFERMSETD